MTKKIVAKVAELTASTRGAPGTAEAPSTADTPAGAPPRQARRRRRRPPPPPGATRCTSASTPSTRRSTEGWDGPLAACEFDADDMASLAATVGYEAEDPEDHRGHPRGGDRRDPRRRREDEARRHLLPHLLRATAARCRTSAATSGWSAPRTPVDETLCLFDGQVVDDELYALWAAFPADSRVLVVFDCCHSGSDGEGPADRRPDRHRDHPRPGAARHPARRRRPGRAQAPGDFYTRDLRRGDRHLGRAGRPARWRCRSRPACG